MLKSHERVLSSLGRTPRLLEQFNVRYVLTGPHYIHGASRNYLPVEALRRIAGVEDRGSGVVELPSPLPAAYWVPLDRVERVADRPAALARIEALAPSAVAILDGAVDPASSLMPSLPDQPATREGRPHQGRDRPVEARGFFVDRDRVAFEIDAPARGAVVVNEAWYPGWDAIVDGTALPIYRANGLVRAIVVGPGRHRVTMLFRPVDGIVLRWVLLISLLIALAAIARRVS